VQRAISEEIVRRLRIEVSAADRQRLAKRYTLSIPAYEDFLRGQSELLLRERSANQNARNWYYRAIEKDPAFARAYAGLALSYAADFRNQWVDDREAALQQAADTASSAQQIDPSIPEVYWVLGYVDAQKRKPDSALAHLHRALELDQSYADAHALMGGIDTYRGRPELSIPRLRQAMRLNPGAGYLYYLLLGRAYFFLGDVEQAQINLRESLSRNPDNLEARIYLAATTAVSGDPDAALWEIDEIRVMDPEFDLRAWLETYPMVDQGQIGQLNDALARAGL
jgi:tetratricopeptide (TPR) repeat protein